MVIWEQVGIGGSNALTVFEVPGLVALAVVAVFVGIAVPVLALLVAR